MLRILFKNLSRQNIHDYGLHSYFAMQCSYGQLLTAALQKQTYFGALFLYLMDITMLWGGGVWPIYTEVKTIAS